MSTSSENRGPSPRGFAAMDAAKQREIASKGGKAAHEKGTAHEFDSEEARRAGRLGGEAVSQNRAHMAEIGSKGGQSRGRKHQASKKRSDDEQQGEQTTVGSQERDDATSQRDDEGTMRGGSPEQHAEAGRHKNDDEGGNRGGKNR